MSLKKLKKILLKDKAFREVYYAHDIAFEIADMVFRARINKGINQKQLSKLVGTKQPSIARLEAGKSLPSLRFLEKIAKALDTKLIAPKFEMFENIPSANLVINRGWFLQSETPFPPSDVFSSYSFSEGKILEAVAILNISNNLKK
jgi:transcriptional regulator with XRE-family HTH domain